MLIRTRNLFLSRCHGKHTDSDYPQIVKHPAGLWYNTEKNEWEKYHNPDDFAADMCQVFANCMLYNQEGSDYYVIADKTKQFEKRFLKVSSTTSITIDGVNGSSSYKADPTKPPTFPEKAKFSESLYDVAPDILGRVVQMLDEENEQHSTSQHRRRLKFQLT